MATQTLARAIRTLWQASAQGGVMQICGKHAIPDAKIRSKPRMDLLHRNQLLQSLKHT